MKHLEIPSVKCVFSQPLRTILRIAIATLVGVAVALSLAGTGHAEPSPSEIEKKIDSKWNELEPTIEAHNKLKAELSINRTKSQKLAEQLNPLELRVNLSLNRVSKISAIYFKGGKLSAFNAILSTGSPTALADQLSLLDVMAHKELVEIRDVITLKDKYEQEKRPLDALLAVQAKQEAELANKEKTINAEIKDLNDLRIRAYGSTVSPGSTRPAPCPYDYTPDAGGRAAKVACAQIGKPYVFGSTGPNTFDCSGLTLYAWANANAGVQLRHYTNWQYSDTKRVSREQLRAGDLVFYYSDLHHVGMYVGGGWIVHAPTSGDVVRMAKLDSSPVSGFGRPVSSA